MSPIGRNILIRIGAQPCAYFLSVVPLIYSLFPKGGDTAEKIFTTKAQTKTNHKGENLKSSKKV